jgi:hypothetical protein
MVTRARATVGALLLLVFAGFATIPVAAQTPVLITQTPIVVNGAGNTIGITMPVTNNGTVQASSMKVISIQMSTAQLLAPSSLPISVGNILPNGTLQIDASFNGRGLTVGARYLLTVRGTYVIGNSTSAFSLNRFVTIPSPAQLLIGINKTDGLLLRVQAASGDSIAYFGAKDSNGLATKLNTVLVTAQSGGLSRFDVDAEGRPLRISGSDGTSFTFVWTSTTSAQVTAISAGGSKKVTISLNTGQTPIAKNSSPSPGLPDSLSAADTSTSGVTARPELLSWKPGSGKGPFASARYCDPAPQRPGASALVTIHVDRCGPVDDANVSLVYSPGGTTNSVTLPATDVPGTGNYNVSVPTLGAAVSSVGEACNSLDGALGNACETAFVMPFVCIALENPATASVTAAFVPECLVLRDEAIEYCYVLGGGLPAGAASVFVGFCSVVTNTIDLATAPTVEIQPVVIDILGNQSLPPVEVNAAAPSSTFTVLYPCFALDGLWEGTAIFTDSGGGPAETDPVSATFTSSSKITRDPHTGITTTMLTVTATVVFTEQGSVAETHNITYQATGSTVTLSGDITMTGTIAANGTGQAISGTGFDAAEGNSGTGSLTFSNGGLKMQGNITSGSDLSPGSGTLTVSADGTHMTGTASSTDGSTLTWTAVKQ